MALPEKHYPEPKLTIKTWAEEDRPREKMLIRGRQALTDAELLALLLGSGTREETAVDLAKRILGSVDNDLNELSRLSLADLFKFKGVGEAKAVMITAALELARRRQTAPQRVRPQIRGSQDAFHIISPVLADLTHEEFWVILLNRANRVMACERVSSGGMVGTVVDGKIVFRKALEGLACSIILCHNHPSGNSQPSQADKALTKRLREAGKTLDIPVVDHIICGDKSYFSFADEGLL